MSYHQNSAGHGGRRCETARKTEVKIHGHHQEGHQKECMYVCITFISDSAIQNNIVIQCWGP